MDAAVDGIHRANAALKSVYLAMMSLDPTGTVAHPLRSHAPHRHNRPHGPPPHQRTTVSWRDPTPQTKHQIPELNNGMKQWDKKT
ncbi:hypothetical protein [Streptomyces sp. 1222.5]|uniref:hypothetical protein n=1 Tax=Streptomyces sp. 1222.5 TaxID=1881026 RepID=UPI003EB72714